MRRILGLLCFIILGTLVQASPADVEKDLNWFRTVAPREDGSDGEALALERIRDRFEDLGLPYEISYLSDTDGGHSFSRNLTAVIEGTVPGTLILAAPIDGGAFGLAFLLEMAEYLQVNQPKHDIRLLFLGAERGNSAYHPYGSRLASEAAESLKSNGTMLLYLDAEEVPARWQIRPGGNGTVSPDWMVKSLTEVFSAAYVPFGLRGTDIQLARLGLQGDISLLTPWMKQNIPSILLGGKGDSSEDDRIRFITRFRDSLANMDVSLDLIPQYQQSSYVFLRPLTDFPPRIIPELPYVISFLGISALLLVIILARYRDVTLNLRRFVSHWWAWPLLVVLSFLYFFLGTLFVEETLLLADIPELWYFAPGIFIFFKLSVAAALSLNFILITRGLPLPRSPHFYSYTAILVSGVASLVFMALEITLAAYSIFTIVILLLFVATKKVRWKAILLFVSLIPYITGLVVIIREPYNVLITAILKNRISGNIILTLIVLPLMLALTSLSYWQGHYKRVRVNLLIPAATLVLNISAVITLMWIMNMNPYNSDLPQPVELTDTINMNSGDRRLQVVSAAPIGDATLSLEGGTYPLEELGRTAEVRTPLNRIPLLINHRSYRFLGRRTVDVTVGGEENPNILEIMLLSDEPFTVHNSDFPFQQSADGTTATLFVGNHPPFPLELSFTVNGDALMEFNCVATWDEPEDPPGISRTDLKASALRVARLSTQL